MTGGWALLRWEMATGTNHGIGTFTMTLAEGLETELTNGQ